MHPFIRQSIAQAHTDELQRRAAQRQTLVGLDAETGRQAGADAQRVTPRRARRSGILSVSRAHR